MKTDKINEIYESYLNGQRKQMVSQIGEYGVDFWDDLVKWLAECLIDDIEQEYKVFREIVCLYRKNKFSNPCTCDCHTEGVHYSLFPHCCEC